ncbi:MAG: hypothetical protein NC123_20955 [Butyrivibrio sp.]|nr:hypothetical protein [Butyrivibrio sp.]
MHKEAADDVTTVTFINIGVVIHESIVAFLTFMTGDDFGLFHHGYL